MLQMASSRKINRDIYLAYMRQDNPEYSLFSHSQLHQALSSEFCSREDGEPRKKKRQRKKKLCSQEHDAMAGLYLGVEKGLLHLWENGSVLNWTCRKDGWPTVKTAEEILVATYRACERWNEVMEGRIRFKYVDVLSDAAFEVQYSSSSGGFRRRGLLATAFFPCDYDRDLNFIRVSRSAFSRRYLSDYPLYNTMLHELGHVVGLRHNFAHEKGRQEAASESILFGIRNTRSIMSYSKRMDIQESDAIVVRKAYDELLHGTTISAMGAFGEIKKVVRRVSPDN